MKFLATLALAALSAFTAQAALPVAPSNIVAFPMRDMVTIEGFAERTGQQMKVEVLRGTTVVGSTIGTVSGDDVAFDVNHPGGVCWGAGTNLKVTPSLQAGDRIQVSIAGSVIADSTILDTNVESVDYTAGALSFTVTGQIAASIPMANFECRIVNPAMTTTVIAKRDIRAVLGDFNTKAFTNGYRSGVVESTVGGVRRWKATFEFDPNAANAVAVAQTAATGGGARANAWMAGAGQGMTIWELGEVKGPGVGGCPAGPDTTAPGVGTVATVFGAGNVKVSWSTPAVVPGGAAISGYDVIVMPKAVTAGLRKTTGFRTAANINTVTVSDASISLDTSTVQVRSLVGTALSNPFIPAANPQPVVDITLTLTPPAGADETAVITATSVTIASNVQIYYATNLDTVMTGGIPSDAAIVYDGQPILIGTKTTLHIAAIHANGQFKVQTVTYQPPAAVLPQPPTAVKATAAPGGAILTWTAPADASITGYAAQQYDATNTEVGTLHLATGGETLDRRMVVEGLAPGVSTTLALKSMNKAGIFSVASEFVTVTPLKAVDTITIAKARQQQRDLRVDGTGSDVSATFTLHNACGNAPCPEVLATAGADAAGAFVLRNKAAAPGILNVWVKSSKGGIAGPVKVAA
ncbi:uncharacterized protein EV422DRAFT_104271 [Fimicolochytrium jonesii]|uniref:uncharacterized protein n=1 Tax=Fimicolochytrium jonesii TaxID=1396493 RepID=UPI0022FE042C|nr:uncharacterized protein EV422DRAFT_104271 [Fimicolochytrium jonesii]KAI8819715.1 hypothetical protein EV422DRAFT_104271 [Fimicolochytrium jonesii]